MSSLPEPKDEGGRNVPAHGVLQREKAGRARDTVLGGRFPGDPCSPALGLAAGLHTWTEPWEPPHYGNPKLEL